MGNILGLDLGPNSIGWGLVDQDSRQIVAAGSRIIPMDAAAMSEYEKGNLKSQVAERRMMRSVRRMYDRHHQRRERLLRVLHVLGFLPNHFQKAIDFEGRKGKFLDSQEPLLAYAEVNGKRTFLFMESFSEMLHEFTCRHPDLMACGKKIPYDWTLYYLRKKALTERVSKEELSWILLSFNSKRGYYQLDGDDESAGEPNKREELKSLKVIDVKEDNPNEKRKGEMWYQVTFEEGYTRAYSWKSPMMRIGDQKELIITTRLDHDGNPQKDKDGQLKYSIRIPQEDDWTLRKKRTENSLDASGLTVGTFIYQSLLDNPSVKIKGKLVRVVERKYYKEELKQILDSQKRFHSELTDARLYQACLQELYPSNDMKRQSLLSGDVVKLIWDDVIFYQRPLKSKKYLISECPFEKYHFRDKKTGEVSCSPIKCVPKSHPLYGELRVWQFISNLKILTNDDHRVGTDATSSFLPDEAKKESLFRFLNDKKEISQEELLRFLGIGKKDREKYRWNYINDDKKKYPCNPARYEILKRLKETYGDDLCGSFKSDASCCDGTTAMSDENKLDILIESLWHVLYSVTDKEQLEKALQSFGAKHFAQPEKICQAFVRPPRFDLTYGSFSLKAVRKLLAVMRLGSLWKEKSIDSDTRKRADHIIDGVADESISEKTREQFAWLKDVGQLRGLPIHLACYLVYDRYSEASDTDRWQSPDDIDKYLRERFKQGILRNPVVEQVIGETLRVVRDIWRMYGRIDEVHVELGRSLKSTSEQRSRMTLQNIENESRNLRIRHLLQEFFKPEYGIENVRPYSPSQAELLKIYEDGALNSQNRVYQDGVTQDDVDVVVRGYSQSDPSKWPSSRQIMKYKLYLEQNYRSPYTGRIIPLSRLFTPDYEIEHIIPQSRFYDDSLSNKVICESELNKLKDKMLAYEFIKHNHGKPISGNMGKTIRVFEEEEYLQFVNTHYPMGSLKRKKLLMDDIPDSFIERQMNDTRYISREIIHVLSKLVREEGEQEATAKRVVSFTGGITDTLKKEWGINDVWNELVSPRFKRMNEKTGTQDYGCERTVEGKKVFQTHVPDKDAKGFSKKRIDHRHHAMDALILAAATRNHVNLLNNMSANNDQQRHDLKHLLCFKDKTDERGNFVWRFRKPWDTFTQDVKKVLAEMIVSIKHQQRVITKMTNHYQKFVGGRKQFVKQTDGDGWAIRKPLHKDSYFGRVSLQKEKVVPLKKALEDWTMIKDGEVKKKIRYLIKGYGKFDPKQILAYFKGQYYKIGKKDVKKVTVYYQSGAVGDFFAAKRVRLSPAFTSKNIDAVTDSGVRKILQRHLEAYQDNVQVAFSPEGIDQMNQNIQQLNGGKPHKPIYSVRLSENLGQKFQVGSTGSKTKKYVEAAKGTNLFFAIYKDEEGKREYETIPLNVVVERLKQGVPIAPSFNENGSQLLFTLSPSDFVYVPKEEDEDLNSLQRERIYVLKSSNGSQAFFIPCNIASPIVDTQELGSNNKSENSWDGEQIKSCCWKLEVDRLGRIVKVVR